MAVSQAVASDYTKRLEAFKTFEKQASRTSSHQQVRRELQHLSESSLLRNHRRLRRLQDSGRFGGCKTGCKPKRRPAQSKEVSARVGKAGSCENKTANNLSFYLRPSGALTPGCCGSHKVASWSGIEPTPRRAFGDLKDGTGQRKHSLSFSSHAFPQRGFEEIGPTKGRQVSFQSGLSSASQHLGEQHARQWVAQESLSAVPVKAQQPFTRSASQPSVGSGSKDEGQMACRFFGQKVRGSCTPSSTIPTASKPTAGEVPFSTDSVRTAGL